MPPSGYSQNQSNSIIDFLASCSIALKEEAKQKSLSPCQALVNECSNIVSFLNEGQIDTITLAVLELTMKFYRALIELQPVDFDQFDKIVQEKVLLVKEGILAVHVPEF